MRDIYSAALMSSQTIYKLPFSTKDRASMKLAWTHVVAAIIVGLFLSACAAKRPVLYPNDHFNTVGKEAAQRDIDACLRLAADQDLESKPEKEVATSTAKGAAVGTAVGVAIGAVTGNLGRAAAAGAAGGGTGGCLSGLVRSRDPDPLVRRFVETCLQKKGYEPIGWR
jgi:outer membrane lipoprotein SlyB